MATEVEKQGGNAAQNHLPIAEEMLEFINKSATQFHAVGEYASNSLSFIGLHDLDSAK